MRRDRLHTLAVAGLLSAIALVACLPAQAAKTKKSRDEVIIPAEFPDVTDAERALKEVANAKGAPAVILLEAQQTNWQGLEFKRIRYVRRTKILTDAGVEDYGNFSYRLWGSWRVHKVQARTVLPDGTIVDASDNVFQEKSRDLEYQSLNIAFPRVETGAILDVMIDMNSDAVRLAPWVAQTEIPVVESRFTIFPPPGLRFFPMAFPPEAGTAEEVTFGNENGFVWTFRDVPPLPDVAFMAPPGDIAQRLVVILTAYKDRSNYLALATDWKQFSKRRHELWKEWIDETHRKSADLARAVVGAAATDRDKAEAIRLAVRQRVSSEYGSYIPMHATPDEVLERGFGTSADLAGLSVAMLKAVGVKADLMALRRRSGGSIPLDRPVPALLDEVLVRLPGSSPLYFSPSAALPVGQLPWDCTGVGAIALDGKSEQLVLIPNLTADDNSTRRDTDAELHADGRLSGRTVHTFKGSSADLWRRRMVGLDEEQRRERFARELGRHMEGVRIHELALEHLDGGGDTLVVTSRWDVAGYAAQAGTRLIVNPNLFVRQSAEGWGEAERKHPVQLRMAFDEQDAVSIKLPEGVGEVNLPGDANVNAGGGGFFKAGCERQGETIVATRHMRLNLHSFAPEAYRALSQWFTAAATADDRPVVANLNP